MAKYQLDPAHSSASFSIKHMMIAKVRGTFDQLSGTLEYDSSHPERSQAQAEISTASINTHESQRDQHLRSADFFDVEKFPQITFVSKSVTQSGDELKIRGDLTIKDTTQEVTLLADLPSTEIKDPWGQLKIGISASTKINRKDFGLTWNAALEAGGVLVGEDVAITLDLQFIKQA